MVKLLSANFLRLWKDKLFWLSEIIMIIVPVMECITGYRENREYSSQTYMEDFLFSDYWLIIFVIAVFVSIFIGTEYSDGTMKNKLIVGHSRMSIYFSNFIVCIVFSVIMRLSYMAVILCLGLPLLGSSNQALSLLIKYSLCSFAAIIAVTSIILFVSMIIQSKSAASVTAVIFTLISFFCAVLVVASLELQGYIEGTKRVIFEYISEIFPYCQLVNICEICGDSADKLGVYPLYSFAIIFICTGLGIMIYKKKDLR